LRILLGLSAISSKLAPVEIAFSPCALCDQYDETKRNSIVFVISPKYRHIGSTIMRVDQIKMLIRFFFPKIVIDIVESSALYDTEFGSSTVVLSKGAIYSLKNSLPELNTRIENLWLDPLDSAIDNYCYEGMNFISSSRLQSEYFASRNLNHIELYHAPDWRALLLSAIPKTRLAAYVGSSGRSPNGIQDLNMVDSIITSKYSKNWKLENWIKLAASYKAHFITGPDDRAVLSRFKPLTKGLNAILLGAIPLIGNWDDEARALFGAEYI
jgi:hypothetical protein